MDGGLGVRGVWLWALRAIVDCGVPFGSRVAFGVLFSFAVEALPFGIFAFARILRLRLVLLCDAQKRSRGVLVI